MLDRDKVFKGLESQLDDLAKYADSDEVLTLTQGQAKALLVLLKEQEAIIDKYRRADGFLAAHGWKWEGR